MQNILDFAFCHFLVYHLAIFIGVFFAGSGFNKNTGHLCPAMIIFT
jgi:hypothetical protein